MPTWVVILYPLVTLLLLPLFVAVLLHIARWYWHGRPALLRSRVAWAALCFAIGAGVTAFVLAVGVLRPERCRAQPRGSVAEADSFVVFGFGLGPTVNGKPTPGASNRALAQWLLAHNPERKPTVVQEGIYLALEELNAVGPWVIRLSDRPGVYVDTLGAANQAEAVLHLGGLTRPIVVAHDLQLQRAVWSCEAVGLTECVVPELPPTPFDPESVQHGGTRSESEWVRRELLVARPVTLRPQTTMVVVALTALLCGLALRLV
jgi:hypothetical protein